jgi:hypothetical protein
VAEGSEAVLLAYSSVGLGWLMAVLRFPLIRWLIDGLYAFVSRHRYTISRLVRAPRSARTPAPLSLGQMALDALAARAQPHTRGCTPSPHALTRSHAPAVSRRVSALVVLCRITAMCRLRGSCPAAQHLVRRDDRSNQRLAPALKADPHPDPLLLPRGRRVSHLSP